MRHSTQKPRSHQRGVTLVEMMIAMAIGLFMTAIIAGLYINMRGGFSQQEEVARMQENARFAMDAIARDARMAGFTGCGNSDCFSNVVAIPANSNSRLLEFATPVRGYLHSTTDLPQALSTAGSVGDAVVLLGVDSSSELLINAHDTTTATFTTPTNSLQAGEIMLASDGIHASMFQMTGPAGATKTTVLHTTGAASPGNCTKDLGKDCAASLAYQYKPGSSLTRVYSNTYYIAPSATGSGNSLYALRLSGRTNGVPVATELVVGVQDMYIQYGLGALGSVTSWVDAAATSTSIIWTDVIALRISLLMASNKDNLTTAKQIYIFRDLNGDGKFDNADEVTATDRRLYKVFTETITVRNKAS